MLRHERLGVAEARLPEVRLRTRGQRRVDVELESQCLREDRAEDRGGRATRCARAGSLAAGHRGTAISDGFRAEAVRRGTRREVIVSAALITHVVSLPFIVMPLISSAARRKTFVKVHTSSHDPCASLLLRSLVRLRAGSQFIF